MLIQTLTEKGRGGGGGGKKVAGGSLSKIIFANEVSQCYRFGGLGFALKIGGRE